MAQQEGEGEGTARRGNEEMRTEALINEGRRMWESRSDEGIRREETSGGR